MKRTILFGLLLALLSSLTSCTIEMPHLSGPSYYLAGYFNGENLYYRTSPRLPFSGISPEIKLAPLARSYAKEIWGLEEDTEDRYVLQLEFGDTELRMLLFLLSSAEIQSNHPLQNPPCYLYSSEFRDFLPCSQSSICLWPLSKTDRFGGEFQASCSFEDRTWNVTDGNIPFVTWKK